MPAAPCSAGSWRVNRSLRQRKPTVAQSPTWDAPRESMATSLGDATAHVLGDTPPGFNCAHPAPTLMWSAIAEHGHLKLAILLQEPLVQLRHGILRGRDWIPPASLLAGDRHECTLLALRERSRRGARPIGDRRNLD